MEQRENKEFCSAAKLAKPTNKFHGASIVTASHRIHMVTLNSYKFSNFMLPNRTEVYAGTTTQVQVQATK